MNEKSSLGDCCRKHDPATAPVVYPYRATLLGDNLRGEYRCACGNEWSCWWSARAAGWTAGDIAHLNWLPGAGTENGWFHRGPCHACGTCGVNGCYVWNDSRNPEIHICANGCDGLPEGLGSAA
jgi:hypothetical protein